MAKYLIYTLTVVIGLPSACLGQDEYLIEKALPKSMVAHPRDIRPHLEFVPQQFMDFANFAEESLGCKANVDVYDGDSYIIQSPNYPNLSPPRTRCQWRLNIKPGVATDIMCSDFSAPCWSRSFVHFSLLGKWRRMCTLGPKTNQRIRILVRNFAFTFSMTYFSRQNPSGRLFCTIRGMGGMSRPGETTTTTVSTTTTDTETSEISTDGSETSEPVTEANTTTTTTTESPAIFRCGTKPLMTRIINGNNADENEYPWMAFLILGGSSCGGTIINDRWILTAAHCSAGTSAKDIRVFLGCHRLTPQSCDPPRSVARNIIHPEYGASTLRNDIALLQLSSPITFNNRVQPVCLPTTSVPLSYTMVTTGWGRTSNGGSGSNVLKEARVRSISDSQCRRFFNIPNSVLCVNSVSGSTCQGDSGGFMGSRRNGRFEQDGIVSFGSANGCGLQGVPDGFTEVTAFLSWIRSIAF